MKYILDSNEMKKADRETSDYFGISPEVLMERAAVETVRYLKRMLNCKNRILVVAGCGNNGGDGIAIARLLNQENFDVTLAVPFCGTKSELMQKQLDIYTRYRYPMMSKLPDDEYDIMIDSIFGIGLSRVLQDDYADWVTRLNQMHGKKISIDICSGLNADSGKVMGCCFQADVTITYGFVKRGHLLGEGKKYSGELVCLPIGITEESLHNYRPKLAFFEPSDIKLETRSETVNKGSCGKLLIIAGNQKISGAAILASKAAYRIGTGMVKVFTHVKNRDIIAETIPECLISDYEDQIDEASLKNDLDWCDAVLIGPGFGTELISGTILDFILEFFHGPMMIDADAINLIALSDDRKKQIQERTQKHQFTVILPHMMEFSRLINEPVKNIQENTVSSALKYVEESGAVLVLKDSATLICENESMLYIPHSGNSALATAGTGDVLAGMISGLVTQGVRTDQNLFHRVLTGCCLHGLIADRAIEKGNNKYSFMAGDLCDQMKETLGEYLS